MFRCSGNIAKPKVEKTTYLLALRENVKGCKRVYGKTTRVMRENEDKSQSIIQAWTYEQYNLKRKENKENE